MSEFHIPVAAPAKQRSQVISTSECPRARSPGCTFFLKKTLCSVHTITEAKQSNRQGGARAVDLPARSFDLARPGVAPPLNNRLPVKTTPGTLRNGELSRLKQHNFVIYRYNSTKLSGKVYILLLNSCVKFHAEISRKVTGGYFFMFTLYAYQL